jgi:hypothetical protein
MTRTLGSITLLSFHFLRGVLLKTHVFWDVTPMPQRLANTYWYFHASWCPDGFVLNQEMKALRSFETSVTMTVSQKKVCKSCKLFWILNFKLSCERFTFNCSAVAVLFRVVPTPTKAYITSWGTLLFSLLIQQDRNRISRYTKERTSHQTATSEIS